MKTINLIKTLPILSTLIILFFICVNNQKEDTKIKILIWETPALKLGTYIAISAGTGFILSYFATTKLSYERKTKLGRKIKYNIDSQKENTNFYQEIDKQSLKENTLIERDLNDPSPTLNASFRVIGKTNKKDQLSQFNENYKSDFIEENDNQYNNKNLNYKYQNEINPILNDWEDDTYLNW